MYCFITGANRDRHCFEMHIESKPMWNITLSTVTRKLRPIYLIFPFAHHAHHLCAQIIAGHGVFVFVFDVRCCFFVGVLQTNRISLASPFVCVCVCARLWAHDPFYADSLCVLDVVVECFWTLFANATHGTTKSRLFGHRLLRLNMILRVDFLKKTKKSEQPTRRRFTLCVKFGKFLKIAQSTQMRAEQCVCCCTGDQWNENEKKQQFPTNISSLQLSYHTYILIFSN